MCGPSPCISTAAEGQLPVSPQGSASRRGTLPPFLIEGSGIHLQMLSGPEQERRPSQGSGELAACTALTLARTTGQQAWARGRSLADSLAATPSSFLPPCLLFPGAHPSRLF